MTTPQLGRARLRLHLVIEGHAACDPRLTLAPGADLLPGDWEPLCLKCARIAGHADAEPLTALLGALRERLATERERRGLSYAAAATSLGLPKSVVHGFEHGQDTKLSTVLTIAAWLDQP